MGVLERARAHLRRRRALAKRTALEVAKLWTRIDRNDIARSWAASVPAAVTVVESGQAIAAAQASGYLDDLLEDFGLSVGAAPRVRIDGFVGTAADGRDLATLLFRPAITALQTIRAAPTVDRQVVAKAMASGRFVSDLIVGTEVSDAGRAADQAALAAETQLDGWVRMLNLPSCARCIQLAGQFYRWNSGFERHPGDDCVHIPATEDAADDLTTDPMKAFESLTEAEQNRLFTEAGAQAIRDGADLNQVVNSRRGMTTVGETKTRVREDGRTVNVSIRRQTTTRVAGRDILTTREGAGRRVRLMPAQIYKEANGNREEALRLLRLHGYLLL